MSPPSLFDLVSFDLTGLKLQPQDANRVSNIQWVLFQIDFVHTPRDIFSDDSVCMTPFSSSGCCPTTDERRPWKRSLG